MDRRTCEGPICPHPANPHYLCYKGSPVLLLSSDQRFRAVVNRDFDYVAFFDKTRAKGMNFTRIYPGSYVWFEGPGNAPAWGRQLLPWKQTAASGAHEKLGGRKYDLDQWDEAFFARLDDFCAQAETRDIIVMVSLFNGMHKEVWENQPLYRTNNVQGAGDCEHDMVQSLDADPRLAHYQERYVVELTRRLNGFDNVLYYLCSEPQMSGQPRTVYEPWLNRMLDAFRKTEESLPKRHLIGQSVDREFWRGPAVTDMTEDPRIDFVTGRCMYSFRWLEEKYAANKPFVHHGSVHYHDGNAPDDFSYEGDPLLSARAEAWEYVVGGSASYMQYNSLFTTEHPAGSGSIDAMLDTLAVLRGFMESFRYVEMRRDLTFVRDGVPADAHTAGMSERGRQYAFYVHHGKPGNRFYLVEPGRHQESITFDFPAGEYLLEWVSPAEGAVLGAEQFAHAGGPRSFQTPVYEVDLAMRVKASR